MSSPQLLDGQRLLGWLGQHAQAGSPVRRAIYDGLTERIRRGDFNAPQHEDDAA